MRQIFQPIDPRPLIAEMTKEDGGNSWVVYQEDVLEAVE
jgi:hypothetical protein